MKKFLLAYLTLGAIIPPLPNNIIDGQIIDAVPVMQNFNAIVAAVNANAAPVGGGGTTPLTATLVGFGSNTNLLTGSVNMTWDNTNFRLSLGVDNTQAGNFRLNNAQTGRGVDIFSQAGGGLTVNAGLGGLAGIYPLILNGTPVIFQSGGVQTGQINGTRATFVAATAGPGSNVFFGGPAGNLTLSGSNNVAIGTNAAVTLTTGNTNIAIGTQAIQGATSAQGCTIIGHQAGFNFTSEVDAVAIGRNALGAGGSIAIGALALTSCVAGGNFHTAVGWSALTACTSVSTGNTAVGYNSAASITSGNSHVAIGYGALNSVTTNSGSTAVGASAGSVSTGSNCGFFGNGAQPSAAGANNEYTIGNSSVAVLRCQVALTVLSDERDKKDIVDIPVGLDFLNLVRAIKYEMAIRGGGRTGVEPGFSAQQLQQIQRDTGNEWMGLVYESNPDKLEITTTKLLPVMVKAIQELSAEVELLKRAA